jgi:hypothetical protein
MAESELRLASFSATSIPTLYLCARMRGSRARRQDVAGLPSPHCKVFTGVKLVYLWGRHLNPGKCPGLPGKFTTRY